MLQLEMPHVNVLSKIDLVEKFGKLTASLEVFTDASNLEIIVEALDRTPTLAKFQGLNRALAEVIEDFGLVSFETLNIQVRLFFIIGQSHLIRIKRASFAS